MKILIDARLYGLENTGVGRYVMNLLDEVQKQDAGNEYVVLLRRKYYNSLNLKDNFKKILADFGVYSISEQYKLPRILFSERPDLCHFPNFNIPFFWVGKYVVTLHDLTTHISGREATNLPLILFWVKKFVYKILFARAVNKSVKIIVPTEVVKNDLSDYYKVRKNKIVVTQEGINGYFSMIEKNPQAAILNKYKVKANEYIIYAGNVYPHKNLRKVLDAMSYLKEKGLETKLLLVTKKDKFSKVIFEYAKDKGLVDSLVNAGFVSDEELRSLYKNSSAFIYPSLKEGFGLQGLEALASGTKLLASDIPVFKEVYGNCAFYFDPMNHYSIANAIEKALNSKNKDGIKELLGQYSWPKMAKETLEVYNSTQ